MKAVIKIVLAFLMLLCLADMPYGFYILVRYVSAIAFTYLAYDYFNSRKEGMGFVFATLTLMFQPFFKIALGRTIWNVVDIIVAFGLICLVVIENKQRKNRNMKKLYHVMLLLAWVGWAMSCSTEKMPQWAERLNEILLPTYMQGDSLTDVYFKYNQTVNGYEVTARWRPYGKMSEVGPVLLNFHNIESGLDYSYFSSKYHSYDTDKVSFAKGFAGHHNGDIHYFNYTSPDSTDSFKDRNGNSPLGYYTPFQFLDIDFDGKEELLISDWYQGQMGNGYEVYKMTGSGLHKVDFMPLNNLTNLDKIDLKTKTVTKVSFSGAEDQAEFYFSNKERKDRVIEIPKFSSNCAANFDFEKYNAEIGAPFVLDSIKESTVKNGSHYDASYYVSKNKIIRK